MIEDQEIGLLIFFQLFDILRTDPLRTATGKSSKTI